VPIFHFYLQNQQEIVDNCFLLVLPVERLVKSQFVSLLGYMHGVVIKESEL
jgi:hypothetical protein